MSEERGTAIIQNLAGWIELSGSSEQVKFKPAAFKTIVNGQQVRFWRYPSRSDWAEYVLPIDALFDAGRLVALAHAGAGLTPLASAYLERRTVKMLARAHAAQDAAFKDQQLKYAAEAMTKIAAARGVGAAPLGVQSIRSELKR